MFSNNPSSSRPTVKIVRLTDAESTQFGELPHLAFPDGNSVKEVNDFVAEAKHQVGVHLSTRVREELADWSADPGHESVVIVENCPIDLDLPPTPVDGRRSPDKLTSTSETILVGVGASFGEPVSFEAERDGHIVQDLTVVRGKEAAQTNEGSDALGWHTEHAATGLLLPDSPRVVDYLVFMGLRADHQGIAKTLVSDVRDAIRIMEPKQVDSLWKPEFVVRPPLLIRKSSGIGDSVLGPVPVLRGSESTPEVRVALYGDLVEGQTENARRALASLSRALTATRRGVHTQPGRMVIVDNRLTFHARAGFPARFDGMDRWLQRLMVTESLWPLRQWRQGAARTLEIR